MSDLRFQEIDDSNRTDHTYLSAVDKCLFLREYTSRMGFSFGETNSHVINLKKKKTDGGYKYKAPTIQLCADEMFDALNAAWLASGTLVPIPPSKVRGHPLYDDRILQVCQAVAARSKTKVDVRELILQKASMDAAHEQEIRPSIEEILDNYLVNEAIANPPPTSIGLVDDMLTVGTHFKAAQRLLHARFPKATIFGLFWTRRVFPNPV